MGVALVLVLVLHHITVSQGLLNCTTTETRHQTFKVNSGPDQSTKAPCVLMLHEGEEYTFELCVFHYLSPTISLTTDWHCADLIDTDKTCATKKCGAAEHSSSISMSVTDACNRTFTHVCGVLSVPVQKPTTQITTRTSINNKHKTTKTYSPKYSTYENHVFLLLVIPFTMGVTLIGVVILMYNERLYCFSEGSIIEKVNSEHSKATSKSITGSGFNSSDDRFSQLGKSISFVQSTAFETDTDVDGPGIFAKSLASHLVKSTTKNSNRDFQD